MNTSIEINRLIQNLIRIGQVFALDLSMTPPSVRVQCGDMQTDWLPWTTTRAGGFTTWAAPIIGETVLMLSPSGDPAGAVIVASLYNSAQPALEQSGDVMALHATDGAVIRYDRSTHTLDANVPGTANVTAKQINITGPVTFNDAVTMKKTLAVTGVVSSQADVTASGISLVSHIHSGVKAGSDTSGTPQ